MPRKLPPYVERNRGKGKNYYSFCRGKGPRIRLPSPTAENFHIEYSAALIGAVNAQPSPQKDKAGSIGALIAFYLQSGSFLALNDTSKTGYMSRLNTMRKEHSHRSVAGLTKDRINAAILADRPGAALDISKSCASSLNTRLEKGALRPIHLLTSSDRRSRKSELGRMQRWPLMSGAGLSERNSAPPMPLC